MYGAYLSAVFRRALQPTVRVTDGLQILAASAAPAIAKATGLPVPETDNILAYIGAAAIAFIALRLFFVAPYQVWRDQAGEIGGLKLELSKPEQLEARRLAKLRANAKGELAGLIREIHWCAFYDQSDLSAESRQAINENRMGDCAELYMKAVNVAGKAGVGEAFASALSRLSDFCVALIHNPEADPSSQSFDLLDAMTDYLHGRITAEALALQLPPEPEIKTQP